MNNKDIEDKIYCRRCGRLLVGEHSRNLGFGPHCYRMWQKERSQQIRLFEVGGNNESKSK